MKVKFKAEGRKRKEMAEAIADFLGCESIYEGAPSFAYRCGYIRVLRDGTLEFDERAKGEETEALMKELGEHGYEKEEDRSDITIQMPGNFLTDEQLNTLKEIIASKEGLIKKALGADDLSIERKDGKIGFPWFKAGSTPEETDAYMKFVTALCRMAKKQKRVTAKEREVENEKYAFRCFLLRLGYIGDDRKAERKLLLSNFTGSSAYKSGEKKGGEADGIPEA